MSTGNPPKGSADWLAEQDGADTTPPAKGTQAWTEQPPQPEPAPKGTEAWTEQHSGENAPAPTERRCTRELKAKGFRQTQQRYFCVHPAK